MHGCNRYQTTSDISMATMCTYPPSQLTLSYWKLLLHCCANFPHIAIRIPRPDKHHSDTCLTIWFHVYHLIAHCLIHGRVLLDENKFNFVCVVLLLWHLQNYTQENSLLWWRHILLIFTPVSKLQKTKIYHFIPHMYVF